jgi:Cof subfamily protein (haloacid dehalogenase superfamily)
VVCDVDGTLVTRDKRLTPAAIDAVKRVREAGIHFTVTSSRPPRGLKIVVDALKLTEPVPAFNSGVVVASDLTTVLREKFMEPVVVDRVIATLTKAHLDVWLYTHNEWYVRNANGPYVEHEIHAVQFRPVVVEQFDPATFNRVGKLVGVSEDFAAVKATEKEFQANFGTSVSATRSQKYYLDITHPNANKGEGILLLSELLNIPIEEIATIGDMQNDIYMFRKSGLSIAMGNASPEVQAEAQYVTDTNENDGFAKAMEHYILTQTPAARTSS